MSDTYVFAGPSLFGFDRNLFSEIHFLGPIKYGDLSILARKGARRIGIVDGCFETVAPVRHKEILDCMKCGIEVFGSSSMGALRAAECAAFGMRGIGEVYRQYADGIRIEDGDVAMMHGPEEMGYMPLTFPLVDLDHALFSCHQFVDVGADRHFDQMKKWERIDYRARDLTAVLGCVDDYQELRHVLSVQLSNPSQSLKTLDAMLLLEAITQNTQHTPRHDSTFMGLN